MIFQITVETDNPRARGHLSWLTENCLAAPNSGGVDMDEDGKLHDCVITLTQICDDGTELLWITNLQPDEES